MEVRSMSIYFLLNLINFVCGLTDDEYQKENELMTTKVNYLQPVDFVNWPNGTVPFYISSDHFDNEQSQIIMTSLSLVAFKTCLKFLPVMVPPTENQHVLTFVNPAGGKKCELLHNGHGRSEPHVVELGYDCLQTPWMDRVVLRALGLPFEHNRGNRDEYIDVQYENIEQNEIPLFTKEFRLPAALRALPYDFNSVMHFGDRDYSKNGHRTIIFKDRNTKQKLEGISEIDLRKIQIIYGPECTKRDRQEKIELCHLYPGIPPVNRKKRSIDLETTRSLRVNPDITPPPELNSLNISDEVKATLQTLDIEDEVQDIVEAVFKLSSKALTNARKQYCNDTENILRSQPSGKSDVLGIVEVVSDYAQSVVDLAGRNLTLFCEKSESVDKYQRARCPNGCYRHFYSTKHYAPYHSTKYRPEIQQSTRHLGGLSTRPFLRHYRSGNHNETDTENVNTEVQQKLQDSTVDLISNNEQNGETTAMNSERGKRGVHAREGKRKRRRFVSKREEESTEAEDEDEDHSWRTSSDERNSQKGKRPEKSIEMSPDYDYREEKRKEQDSDEGKSVRDRRPEKIMEMSPDYDYREEKREEQDSDERKNKKDKRPEKSMEKSPDYDYREENRKEKDSDEGKSEKGKRPEKSMEKSPDYDYREENGKEQDIDEGKSEKGKRPEKSMEKSPDYDYREENGKEQDIDEGGPPKTVELSKKNKEFYKQRRWPRGVVKYLIDEDCTTFDAEDLRSRLAEVNVILRQRTCAGIEEIWPRDANKHEDYLVLDNSPDYVTGRVGGRQVFGCVELLAGGQHRQHTAMMVMAMLGFYFELARHDRDSYVKVHMRHIRADKLHHFEKIGDDATLPLPYDYESATHPAWMFWRKLGKKGISTVATYKDKDPDGSIMKSFGQHNKILSEGDIIKINSVYGVKCMTKDNKNSES